MLGCFEFRPLPHPTVHPSTTIIRLYTKGSPVRIFGPIHVSVGPVYVSIQGGRCEH